MAETKYRRVCAALLTVILVFPSSLGLAQAADCGPGTSETNCNTNGRVTSTLLPRNGFLFEPEFPLNSLKTVPIWNELEQLLDNPYRVATCSSLTTAPALVQNTPSTTKLSGSPLATVYPAYCSNGVVRRSGFGVTLPPLLCHPLNYNPTTGEEMRLLNPDYVGGPWRVPYELLQDTDRDPTGNTWVWTYKDVEVTPGNERVEEAEIDYNAPIRPDSNICIVTTEAFPPEGSTICGGDSGEPGYAGFGKLATVNVSVYTFTLPSSSSCSFFSLNQALCNLRNSAQSLAATFPVGSPENRFLLNRAPLTSPLAPSIASFVASVRASTSSSVRQSLVVQTQAQTSLASMYSVPAVPGVASSTTAIPSSARLLDPMRGSIQARDAASGAGGLRKPSLRVPEVAGSGANPNYLWNSDAQLASRGLDQLAPSNENDYVKDRAIAAVLGKALFWDMQIGSDGVQSCGSCHAHAGADNRTKNQMNPNDIGGDLSFEVRQPNQDLVASDFPLLKLHNPTIAADPKCDPPITATVNAGVLENAPDGSTDAIVNPDGSVTVTVCDAANMVPDKNNAFGAKVTNDVASSMGVHFGTFRDIPPIGDPSFNLAANGNGVRSLVPDLRSASAAANIDPIPGYAGATGNEFRRVEPRNTPTVFAAALNFDNFWDGRARHDFNGGSVFGAADPQSHVFVGPVTGTLAATRQIIRFVSLASLATGPGLSPFEMSFKGRNWAKIGKKLLQGDAAQANRVTPLANQLVSITDSVLGPYSNQGGSACAALPVADRSPGSPAAGKPGLCISYPALIRRAFYPALWQNTSHHLNGCYSDGRTPADPLTPNCAGTFVDDPFDNYLLSIASGPAVATNTNQFTQMEANMTLFFGLSIAVWGTLLLPDNTPFDQFLDQNPDMFESIGEVGEPGLVGPMNACTSSTQRHCFRPVGRFRRDANLNCNNLPAGGEGGGTVNLPGCRGTLTRGPSDPDPLLGMDIFQGSNLSLKNPNFRAARCGECHAGPTLTDHTMAFTVKAQLGDFIGEFTGPGNEALVEPLGRTRVISGFLLESEMGENGQDAIERRIINQSIVPNPVDGLAYPDLTPEGPDGVAGTDDDFTGAGAAFFDNGVYNIGVTRCEADQSAVTGACDDIGRGGTDAFGWPLSLAALLLKNLGGHNGGQPCTDSAHCDMEPGQPLAAFDPSVGEGGGGLFEETAQDQQINPGDGDDPLDPLLPPYLAPWANKINVGDAMPEIDELHGGLNTRTDAAMLEGFIDNLGPFNPAGLLNESYNSGTGPQMGTWPVVNRVGRMGSMKAPQLREVELTGPYFHNGGKLTLRQVVDFYARGGDFPITNAEHRDFNIINQIVEVESNLTEQEKVALVDFLLELTDDRVRFERGPFDHPEVILPLDGRAPENTGGRAAMLSGTCVSSPLGPGHRACANGMFLDVPAVGTAGSTTALPSFLGINTQRNNPNCNPALGPISHYCH